MTDFSQDSDLSLEGLVESLIAERIGDCQGLPDGTRIYTETGGDDAGEEDEPEEDRGTPMVCVMANRSEEQWTTSGIYEVEVSVELKAHDSQLSKREFSKVFDGISDAIDCAKSNEDGNAQVHVYSLETVSGSPMEYEDGVRTKDLTFSVFATANTQNGVPSYVTEDSEYFYVPEDA